MGFYQLLPELFVLTMACVILLVDLYYPQKKLLLTYSLTQMTLVISAFISFWLLNTPVFIGFTGNFVRDNLSSFLEILIALVTFITFVFSRDYILSRGNMARGEYYILGLFSMLGMMVLVSAHSLLTIYLGLELLSLPLYAMIAMKRDDKLASEAAIKYFVMGALASGMLLYGISLIFGVTGAIDLHTVALSVMTNQSSYTVLVLGLIFIVIGVMFKLGGAPFRMTVRLLAEMLPSLYTQWQPLLILVAILSMGIGNLLAIVQSNIKRMLAYSGIAHIGYMTLGLLTGTLAGYSAALFYIITYAFMSLAGFS